MVNRIAVLGVLAASCSLAQIDIPYDKFLLSNGLTVLVHEDHKAPIVAVNIWYHVGSKNEKPGKTGFAHLYEHLMFGGSENAKGSYVQAMEKIGATNLNGTTNQDRTNYFENVPTPALDYALFMESDRMGHFINAFDKATLDQQRGVVQNEKRQGENQPYGSTWEVLTKNTYPAGHPYSWTTIGSMEDLNAASLEDVKEWFRANYGPSNTVLVLAGDIDLKTAKEKVTKYFGDIPPGDPVTHQEQWIAKMTGTHRARMQDRVPQTRIYRTWNVPGFGTPEADYLDLASDCLAKGRLSRLYKRLVYDDQLATGASAFVNPSEIGGQFGVIVTVRPGVEVAKAEKALDEEMARFLKDGPTSEELKRMQTLYTGEFLRGLDHIGGFGGKSDILAQAQVFTGDASYLFKTSLERHEKATPADIRKVVNDWLSDGVFELEVDPVPALKATTSTLDRSKAPVIEGMAELKLPKLQRATLTNGLKVILAERHEIPIVNFWMLEEAGFAADVAATPGTASMTSSLLTYGTKTRDALQITEQSESLGAQLSATSSLGLSSIHLSALKRNLDGSLNLFGDIIMNPSFPQADFDRAKKQRLAGIQAEKADPTQVALRVMPGLLFGANHPYGAAYRGTGTAESVGALTREDLAKFHATWYKPNNGTLVVVGDTTLAEITPRLEKVFEQWKRGTAPELSVPQASRPAKSRVYLIDKPGAQQSTILTGEVAPPKSLQSDIALETLNVVFGGSFSGRLNMNLREDKHYSYGASSVLTGARGQRLYMTMSPVQTDKTKEALAEVSRELHDITGKRPVSALELSAAQSNETLELPGSNESVDDLGASLVQMVRYGLPDDYYNTFSKKVMALRGPDVDDAAKSVIHPDQTIYVIVGDRAKIEAGVRELNLGDIEVIDGDGKKLQAGN
ncbi:MAG: pitrilysin family protein [Terriglobia bacterium]